MSEQVGHHQAGSSYSATSLDRAVGAWERAAPADEVIPYFSEWRRSPVLDAVQTARAFAKSLTEVNALKQMSPGELTGRFYDLPIDPAYVGLVPSASFAFSPEYVSQRTNCFRLHRGDWPSLYAVDAGMRLANEAINPLIPESERAYRLSVARASANLIENQVNRNVKLGKGGVFSATPHGSPTIFGTFATISAAYNYSKLHKQNPDALPELGFPMEMLSQGWLEPEFIFDSDGIFAFKRPTMSRACLSTTEYGFRNIPLLENLSRVTGAFTGYEELAQILRARSRDTVRFIKRCWDEDSGGFKVYAEKAYEPDLGHCRTALQLVRTMLELRFITPDDIGWLDAAKVLQYVNSCWNDESGFSGFGNSPAIQATICSNRSAANTLKLTEVSRVYGDFVGNEQYAEEARLLRDRLNLVISTIPGYMDNDQQTCYAFPVQVVNEWTRRQYGEVKRSSDRTTVPEVSDQVPAYGLFLRKASEATTFEYKQSRDSQEFQLRRALEADLSELCFTDVTEHIPGSGIFSRIKDVIDGWPKPIVSLEEISEETIDQLTRGRVVERDGEGYYRLTESPDACPMACATMAKIQVDTTFVERCAELRRTLNPNAEVLRSRESVLEACGHLLRDPDRHDCYIFASSSSAILPEAHHADPVGFVNKFGWLSRSLPEVGARIAPYFDYVTSLNQNGQDWTVHYSWDFSHSANLLRESFEAAPVGSNEAYRHAAKEILTQALSNSSLRLGYYGPPKLRQHEFLTDWKDSVVFINNYHLILVFRNPETKVIEYGLRISAELFRQVLERIDSAGTSFTPLGNVILGERWWATQEADYLCKFGHILNREVKPIRANENVANAAERFIDACLEFTLKQPKLTIDEQIYDVDLVRWINELRQPYRDYSDSYFLAVDEMFSRNGWSTPGKEVPLNELVQKVCDAHGNADLLRTAEILRARRRDTYRI